MSTDTLHAMATAPIAIVKDLQDATSLDILRDGTIAIAEAGAFHISLYSKAGQRVGRIGSYGLEHGDFTDVRFIQALPSGRLLATDRTSRRVQLFDSRGMFVTSWPFGVPAYPGLPSSFVPSQAMMDSEGRLIVLEADKPRFAILPAGSAPADLVDLDLPELRAVHPEASISGGARASTMALADGVIHLIHPPDSIIHRYAVNGIYMGFTTCPSMTTAFHADERGIHCASSAWLLPARRLGTSGYEFTTAIDGDPVAIHPSDDGWYILTASTLYRISVDTPVHP